MAAQKVEKKRKRNRKARTEVSSSSSSSEEDSASPLQDQTQQEENENGQLTLSYENEGQHSPSQAPSDEGVENEHAAQPTPKLPDLTPEQAFEAFYLKQATKEFANDLDKLRSAADFRDGSVGVLIEALRQGSACFGVEERRRVGEAWVGREG